MRRKLPIFRGSVGRACVLGDRDEGQRLFWRRRDSVGLHGGDADERVGRRRAVAEDREVGRRRKRIGLVAGERDELEIVADSRLSGGKPALGTDRRARRDGDRRAPEEKKHGEGERRQAVKRGGAKKAADNYQRYCALCHGKDREGHVNDHAPSLRSRSLLESGGFRPKLHSQF